MRQNAGLFRQLQRFRAAAVLRISVSGKEPGQLLYGGHELWLQFEGLSVVADSLARPPEGAQLRRDPKIGQGIQIEFKHGQIISQGGCRITILLQEFSERLVGLGVRFEPQRRLVLLHGVRDSPLASVEPAQAPAQVGAPPRLPPVRGPCIRTG